MALLRWRRWSVLEAAVDALVILLVAVSVTGAAVRSASASTLPGVAGASPGPAGGALLPDLSGACTGTIQQQAASEKCNSAVLRAIDVQHQREGIGPLLLPADFDDESTSQQLMQAVGGERAARGLEAPLGVVAAYESSAQGIAAQDPAAGASQTAPGGAIGGSATLAGASTPLEASFVWMYGSTGCGPQPTSCRTARTLILDPRLDDSSGWLYIGVGLSPAPTPTFALIVGAGFVPLPVTTAYEAPAGKGFVPITPPGRAVAAGPPARLPAGSSSAPSSAAPHKIGLGRGVGLAVGAGITFVFVGFLFGLVRRLWRRRHPVQAFRGSAGRITRPPDDGPLGARQQAMAALVSIAGERSPSSGDRSRDSEIWTAEEEEILSGHVPLSRIFPSSSDGGPDKE